MNILIVWIRKFEFVVKTQFLNTRIYHIKKTQIKNFKVVFSKGLKPISFSSRLDEVVDSVKWLARQRNSQVFIIFMSFLNTNNGIIFTDVKYICF